SLRTPDGRRAWLLEGRFETVDARGDVTSVALAGAKGVPLQVGNGVVFVGEKMSCTVLDVARGRIVAERPLAAPRVFCLGRLWLVPAPGVQRAPWQLLDPETGATTAVPDEIAHAEVVAVLRDGSVLMATRGRLLLGRLPDGPLREIALPDGFVAPHGWAVSL